MTAKAGIFLSQQPFRFASGFEELEEAYELLSSFMQTVDTALEGDHPMRWRIERWLLQFESR